MLHVLHLMGRDCDFQTRRSSQLLCSALAADFPPERRWIGRGGDYRIAAHAAISLRAGSGTEAELIHAWDLGAFIAALGSAIPTVFSPSVPLLPRAAWWLRLAAPRHSVHLVAATEVQRADWVRWGAVAERCHVIWPAVDPGILTRHRNQPLREQLGFAPDDYVILAPGETTIDTEHWRALWAASILHVLDDRYRILLWGRGRDVHIARNLARRLGQERLLVVAEKQLGRSMEFDELVWVSDAALVAGRGDVPMLPVLSCMEAGLPVVAAESRITAALLRPDQTGIVVRGGAPRELARAILRLREQPDLARALGQAALVDVGNRFGATRYLQAMRRVYWAAGMSGGEPPLSSHPSAEAVAGAAGC